MRHSEVDPLGQFLFFPLFGYHLQSASVAHRTSYPHSHLYCIQTNTCTHFKMPALRKRALQELDAGNAQPPKQAPKQSPKPPSLVQRIRNMWQFANLYQFIMLFGKALKLDDSMDIGVGCLRLTRPPGCLECQGNISLHSRCVRTWKPSVSNTARWLCRTLGLAFSSSYRPIAD